MVAFMEEESRVNVFANTSKKKILKTLAFEGSTIASGRKHTTVLATTMAHDLAILRFYKIFSWFTFACEGLLECR